tara:strand:+ start:524 stop:850 length:327 start_codon:yes stop_codon:yes gene_type:complete
MDIFGKLFRQQTENNGSIIDDFAKYSAGFKKGSSLDGLGDLGMYRAQREKMINGKSNIFTDIFMPLLREKSGNISTLMPEVKVTPKAHDAIDKEISINSLLSSLLSNN